MPYAFALNTIDITPAAQEALAAFDLALPPLLDRHRSGDWGDLPESLRQANDLALVKGGVVESRFVLDDETALVVSTSHDRARTRVFLESEYEQREVGVQEGYAIWAASYDHGNNPLIAIEEPRVAALLAGLKFPAGARALDVGAGTGRHALRLAAQGLAVTALDQSPEMLAQARQKAAAAGLTLDIRTGSLTDGLPFADASFDLLTCALVLEHVADLHRAVGEFARVLRPGGFLLISDLHPLGVAHGWRAVFERPGARFSLPSGSHTRAAYLAALDAAGLVLHASDDVPVAAIPDGSVSPIWRETHAATPFCLILLAVKLA
ncbi:MAG: class I SAM-dependent methyltransferase [Anaerolineae bacterium]|nr:class I SAM-dependent methyltransferase [Anaerolineae bacterium]